MKSFILVAALVLSGIMAAPLPVVAANSTTVPADYQILPKPGGKIPLGSGHYFIYDFVKPPKLGACVMRLEIFTNQDLRDTSFVVKGDVDMPSMRGTHTTGDRPFVLSAKGVYLLPVPIVMPGDWEFRFTFEKEGKTVFRGAYLFDI